MLKLFDFTMPTRFFVGYGQVNALRELAPQYGKKAMVCAAKDTMRQFGFLDRVVGLLEAGGVSVVVLDDVEPNPKDVDIDRQAKVFAGEGCDFVVGLGGGSALDTAKAMAFLAAQGDCSVRDYLVGGSKSDMADVKAPYPVICIATTAGTGSEATKWLMVTDTAHDYKLGIGHDLLMPAVSIVDPELMISLPPAVTRACGIDVLFHAMEAYLAVCANAFTDMVSLEALRLVMKYLGRAIDKGGEDREAREHMAWASTLGGIAIGEGNSGVVAIHALGQSANGLVDAPHGLTLCPFAVPFLEKTWDADPHRHATLTRIFGYGGDGMSERELAALCPEAMRGVLRQFSCDIKLGELGVTREMVEPMTDAVFGTMAGLLGNSLKKLDRDDVVELFGKAL